MVAGGFAFRFGLYVARNQDSLRVLPTVLRRVRIEVLNLTRPTVGVQPDARRHLGVLVRRVDEAEVGRAEWEVGADVFGRVVVTGDLVVGEPAVVGNGDVDARTYDTRLAVEVLQCAGINRRGQPWWRGYQRYGDL